MPVLTHDPVARAYLLTGGIEYLEKYILGLLRLTRRIESFAMMPLRRDRKRVKGPSKSENLIRRVSTYHNGVKRRNLRVKLSLDRSHYRTGPIPVLLRVNLQHVHDHLASDTYSQGPRSYHELYVRKLITRNTWKQQYFVSLSVETEIRSRTREIAVSRFPVTNKTMV